MKPPVESPAAGGIPRTTTDVPPVGDLPAPAAVEAAPAGAAPVGVNPWRSAVIVLNRGSGSAGSGEQAAQIADIFRARGVEPELDLCEPCDLVARLERACRKVAGTEGAMLVVGGGDGTIKTGAEMAFEFGVPLGVLPMGTMNLLPKDLGMPASAVEAARVIATGVERRIDVGTVNGRVFLHSSAIGVVPLFGAEREEFRKSRTPREKFAAMQRALRVALRVPRVTLAIERAGKRERVRTFSIAVSNNLLSDKPGEAFRRQSLDGGRLGIYISRHQGRLGLFALLFTLGTGRWTLDRQMEAEQVTRVRITSMRRSLPVSNDGEIEKLSTPLNYALKRRGLRVVVARAAPAAPTATVS